ncbi:MAG TPA: hypothetical protein VEX63_02420 [Flavisolibacter sp.]|nr:hypothetical protein [Flavisolibacter sp.]
MLLCNEIRIGNYILINKEIRQVTMINNDPGFADVPMIGFKEKEDNFISCHHEHVTPVPLTNEVLQQCGFTYHSYFHFWQLISSESGTRVEMDIDLDYNLIDYMRRPIVKKLHSLHQLQNLYFALKGTELVFKGKDAIEPGVNNGKLVIGTVPAAATALA